MDFTFDTNGQDLIIPANIYARRVVVHEQFYATTAKYTVIDYSIDPAGSVSKMGAGIPYEFKAPDGSGGFPPGKKLGNFTADVGSIPCSVEFQP